MAKQIVSLSHHGSFTKTERMFEKCRQLFGKGQLDKYGELGVEYLKQYTPKDTGLTSESWRYIITQTKEGYELSWVNDNVKDDYVHIAIILQYGHATRNGTWVEGVDYLNPALRKIFRKLAKDAQEEVHGIL